MIAPVLLAALLSLAPPRPAAPAAPAPPVDAAERADRLEALLGDIHGRIAPDAWRALGPEAAPALVRLATDPGALPSRRGRAIEGLSWLGGPEAEAALRALAVAPGLPVSVRVGALVGAGRLLPPAETTRLLSPIMRGGGHPVERAMAAEVLAQRTPSAACPDVRAQVAREPAAGRQAFQRALDRCALLGR